MDVNTILQAVGTLGFPIVCAVAMAWYVKYMSDRNREDIDKLNLQHQQEMKEVTIALNNNTLALQKLTDAIGNGGIGE
nr:MAG TPA: YvrJ protein family protein [Caudoviricetes sp.]